jgi:predicted TPR repeat methyltransferase
MLRDKHIVGLGCGTGIDSTALSQWAKSPLAFEAGAFDGVVASLCLH